jgi:hopanoid C-3 methylase HpnR
MKLLAVHPSGLMYTKVFLRLEPLGLELIAAAARTAGHDVRIIDLQVERHRDYHRWIDQWQPDAVAFSCNYLANVPEIIDLAKETKAKLPRCFITVGGHSASFTAREILEHGAGAIDCILTGEGEASIATLLEAAPDGGKALLQVPGAITLDGKGPPPRFVESLDDLRPARDLLRHRRKYFIGTLDPAASIEFARGCPWDCTFCSAWTFYGRSYRTVSPEVAVEDLASLREPGVFIVDDVAFVHAQHGMAIAEAARRKGIKKQYYLETRADVLLRNREVFQEWRKLGLEYLFLGFEAIDDEGLKAFRKRVNHDKNFEALELARSLGIAVAINIIADPSWDKARFEVVRQWCLEVPEHVNLTVNTPYPGTETWLREARQLQSRDYRLFDIQHAVLPTTLPLREFYEELVKTQQVMNTKHLGWRALRDCAGIVAGHLMRGQTNFVRALWKFNSVFNPDLQMADHAQPVRYEMGLPPPPAQRANLKTPYLHTPQGRRSRTLDDATEQFVDATRIGADAAGAD